MTPKEIIADTVRSLQQGDPDEYDSRWPDTLADAVLSAFTDAHMRVCRWSFVCPRSTERDVTHGAWVPVEAE